MSELICCPIEALCVLGGCGPFDCFPSSHAVHVSFGELGIAGKGMEGRSFRF